MAVNNVVASKIKTRYNGIILFFNLIRIFDKILLTFKYILKFEFSGQIGVLRDGV